MTSAGHRVDMHPFPSPPATTEHHPFRWAACSVTEFGPVGHQRHLARKGDLTTYCGHSASHPEIWRANSRKPKCAQCESDAERLLSVQPGTHEARLKRETTLLADKDLADYYLMAVPSATTEGTP